MNKEVIKAMQGKKEHKIRKWWCNNGYKVWRVVLFPLWVGVVLRDKVVAMLDHNEEWSDERAAEILNYYIPRRSEWDSEEQCFYFFDNGMGWSLSLAKKFLKRKDRRFWKVNCGFCGGDMRTFLIEKFELDGFNKEVRDTWDDWTEIVFNLNKERG